MRSRFDSQLARLNTELIRMGALCEEAISKAAKALENGDSSLAEQVKPLEGEILAIFQVLQCAFLIFLVF